MCKFNLKEYKEKLIKTIFEEIIDKKFSKWMKDIKP